jgi:hypothetical protein
MRKPSSPRRRAFATALAVVAAATAAPAAPASAAAASQSLGGAPGSKAQAEPLPLRPGELLPLLGCAGDGPVLPGKGSVRQAPICELTRCDEAVHCPDQPNSACLLQSFPDLQWRICVYASRFGSRVAPYSKGLGVGPVYLRSRAQPDAPWRKILHEASLAELFTPYHETPSFRIYDTRFLTWDNWRREVTHEDAGRHGALLVLADDERPSIVAELRDRGPAWLCKGPFGRTVRRGEELVVWGVLDTGNYDFLTEYAFLDDGTIRMRIGATGYNHPARPGEAHLHDALWRIDLDLDGPEGDTPFLVRHLEPDPASAGSLLSVDEHELFNGGVEGSAVWDPLELTTLLVEDEGTNALGHHRGYELHPTRSGTARHFGPLEDWTRRDFWVTRRDADHPTAWADAWRSPDLYLLPDAAEEESIEGEDVVLWYLVSAHHDPIDEDRADDPPANPFAVTLTHWFGLELAPHNFFDHNPLGGPARCGE